MDTSSNRLAREKRGRSCTGMAMATCGGRASSTVELTRSGGSLRCSGRSTKAYTRDLHPSVRTVLEGIARWKASDPRQYRIRLRLSNQITAHLLAAAGDGTSLAGHRGPRSQRSVAVEQGPLEQARKSLRISERFCLTQASEFGNHMSTFGDSHGSKAVAQLPWANRGTGNESGR